MPVYTAKTFWGETITAVKLTDVWNAMTPEQKAAKKERKAKRNAERRAAQREKQALWEEACRNVEARKAAEREMAERMEMSAYCA